MPLRGLRRGTLGGGSQALYLFCYPLLFSCDLNAAFCFLLSRELGDLDRARQSKWFNAMLTRVSTLLVLLRSLVDAQAISCPALGTHDNEAAHPLRKSVPLAQSCNTSTQPPECAFPMPLDHFNSTDRRKYMNYYWVNESYYEPGQPVFLLDHGEGALDSNWARIFLSENGLKSAVVRLAAKYKGIAIMWEHRFYGQSIPFPLKTGFPCGDDRGYAYLTNEQALEDLVYFANHYAPVTPALRSLDLSPRNVPWIIIGGSYPGMRAAMARVRNPETWFASWASSAPVQAQLDMSTYFRPIAQGLPPNCSADIHAAVTHADQILTSGTPNQTLQLRKAVWFLGNSTDIWNMTGKERNDPTTMELYDIASILAYAPSFSIHSFQNEGFESLRQFCDALEMYDPNGASGIQDPRSILNNSRTAPATDGGVAEKYSFASAFEALLYATYQQMLRDTRARPPGNDEGQRGDVLSWKWQWCSEFGWLRGANPNDTTSLISRFLSLEEIARRECGGSFPHLSHGPAVDAVNAKYKGWRMTPSNVMFTNGALDPWRTMGVHADASINPQALIRNKTTTVPTCNKPPPNNAVFGLVYPNTPHVKDMWKSDTANSTPMDQGLALFTKALDQWLPCFNSKPAPILRVQDYNAV